MVTIDVWYVLAAFLLSFISTIIVAAKARKMPINEAKILVLGFFLSSVHFLILFIGIYLFRNNIPSFNNIGLFSAIIKISLLPLFFSWLVVFYALYLPQFKFNYRSIFVIISVSIFFTASALYNVQTGTLYMYNNNIFYSYSLFGFFLVISLILSLGYVVFRRLMQLRNISKFKSGFTTKRSFVLFSVFLLPSLICGLCYQFQFFLQFPIYVFAFAYSLGMAYFSYLFYKEEHYWFVTPTTLEAVLVIDNYTGLALFVKSYTQDYHAEELLANLLSTLDITLSYLLRSSERIEKITLGRKTIVMSSGKWVNTIMITSDSTLITNSIANYLTQTFEQKYELKLKEMENQRIRMINEDDYLSFSTIVEKVKYYLPNNNSSNNNSHFYPKNF